jgi:hypothetical protein
MAANIRVRRSRRDSTLLQSPARVGHASRMRQIFENASRDQVRLQSTSSILYPQLANVSRKASPPPVPSPVESKTRQESITHDLPRYRLESLCLSTDLISVATSTDEARASPGQPSGRFSGSWSDDTGYIVTDNSRIRGSNLALSPKERVQAWLCGLPDCNSHATSVSISDKGSTMPSRSDSQGLDTAYKMSEHGYSTLTSSDRSQLWINRANEANTSPLKVHPSSSLPCYEYLPEMKDRSGNTNISDEDGVQLSPLSPNVCIERGPARYHSNRKPLDITTPSRDGSAIQFRAPRLKENVLVDFEGDSGSDGSFGHRRRRGNRRHW